MILIVTGMVPFDQLRCNRTHCCRVVAESSTGELLLHAWHQLQRMAGFLIGALLHMQVILTLCHDLLITKPLPHHDKRDGK